MNTEDTITIRRSQATDADALRRLAELDSTSLSDEPYLVAEMSGTLLAALGLNEGAVIADPFEPTAHLVTLLQLTATGRASEHRRPAMRTMFATVRAVVGSRSRVASGTSESARRAALLHVWT